ncbi:YhgE/Pip domain-containing protein [Saccharopolyspora karakumensis]|uniref:YhgE/Pip domain-containing protein n=1 Tax=Saccharopolyspora karakumensis TaxID=2530386 RepID=A0A4R5BKD8_9PSEU|nr:YhgE/Pip domain-containing protein [Saccharopolyspora karakumensis]TDD85823.1 YhgE/Pip domain-containing protein [Saccharopolyspora karakumensis]
MTTFRLAATELRRLTSGKLPKLALLAVTLVPLLYGAMYIYANWDPYGKLDSVPAAVVIDDTGAQKEDGQPLNAGQDVYDELIDSGTFSWTRTDLQHAQAGVANGDYTFALVVPRDFSHALVSPADFEPRQAKLQLITNDANNYLVGTIADKLAGEVRKGVASNAGSTAAEQFLLGFSTVHDKTVEAANGAGKLADGAGQLRDGLGQAEQGGTQLSDGAHQLLSGQQQLASGANRLADGTGQLHTGLQQLRASTAQLPEQTAKLADGAEKVAQGNEQLAQKANVVGDLSQSIVDNLDQTKAKTAAQLRQAGVDEATVQKIVVGLDDLGSPATDANTELQTQVGQLNMLADGSRQVADGNRALANATPQLTSGIQQLTSGAGQVDDGAAQLREGQQQALSGTSRLADGADQLVGGTRQLHDGSGRLVDGSTTLATELGKGAGEIPNPDDKTRQATADTIGDPVAVDTQAQVKADTYGAGLAPYFMGLALWVGGFVLFLLMRPMSNRALAAGVAPWRVALGGWLPAALIGLVQAVLLFSVVVFAIGVHPAHQWRTLAFLILTSFAFTAVVHSLNAAFGPKGKFIALVILVLQLVTAGGTFPWQTIPEPLHPLHQVLPLGYVVTGLRHLIYGGTEASVGQAVAVLLCYLVASLLLTTIAAWRQRVWTPSRLKPELSL